MQACYLKVLDCLVNLSLLATCHHMMALLLIRHMLLYGDEELCNLQHLAAVPLKILIRTIQSCHHEYRYDSNAQVYVHSFVNLFSSPAFGIISR